MTFEEKIEMTNKLKEKRRIKDALALMAYEEQREKQEKLQRRKDIITGVAFVLWILCAGIAASLL